MHSQGNLPDYTENLDPLPYYMASIEAMDYQIGRLIESLTEEQLANTTFLFLGDNGTPEQVTQLPYTSTTSKGTLYEGGINTPLIVSGKGVTRTGFDENLVNNTDLFTTIAELTGVSTSNLSDSKSFKNLFQTAGTHREYLYSEMDNSPVVAWTIRNSRYKLFARASGTTEFYDLQNDPYEKVNLLNSTLSTDASQAKAALESELDIIRN